MRKMTYALAFLVALLTGTQWAKADTVSPYSIDFNDEISTTDHEFKVAAGWGHLMSRYYDDDAWEYLYTSYTWDASYGRENTGGLKVGAQTKLGSGYYTSGSTTDLLITPAITGTASIYVKKATTSGSVKFYTVTKSGATYTRGSQITVDVSALSADEWTKVELPEQEGAQVGIWGDNVYLDDFEATSADIVLSKTITLTKVTSNGSDSPDCDTDGNFNVNFTVVIQNTGEVTLNPGDEGYSLSLVNYSNDNAVVYTQALTKTLAVGESDTVTLDATLNKDEVITGNGRNRFDVQENLTKTTKYGAWIEPVAYAPNLVVRYNNDNLEAGKSIAWGMINETVTKEFTLRNKGAAPMNVTAITLPEGFTIDAEAPFTVAAHTDSIVNITLPNTAYGVFAGDVTISVEGLDDFTFAVSGTVLDPSKFYVTFNDGQIPAGCVAEKNWSVAQRDYMSSDNPYLLSNSQESPETMFSTPLLRVTDGEKMTFDVARGGTYSSTKCWLKVYYSTDRKNWTLAKEITKDEMSSTKPVSSYSFGALTTFVLDNVPAGDYYIGFGAGYVGLDNIYGFEVVDVAHDWLVSESNLPATGTVNNAYTATATLKNVNTKAEEAGSYTATLYVGDEAVATAEAVAVEASSDKTFTFTYTPHTAGTFAAYVEFVNTTDGYKAVSDTATVAIAEESSSVDIQIGESAGVSGGKKTPISANYKHSASDAIYTAEALAAVGLKAGDKISKIYYKGYNDRGELTVEELKSWITNTEDETFPETYAFPTTDDWTNLYNGSYTFALIGSSADHQPVLEFPLAEPFVYDGHALRIFTKHDATDYKNIYMEYTNDKTHAYAAHSDAGEITETQMGTNELPVLYLSVVRESPVFSGTVTDGDDVVAGATVTLTNGDVIYTTTTDEQGAYSLTVVQSDKKYALTVEAEDYEPYADADSVDVTATTTKDITLTLKPVTVTLEEGVWATFSSKKSVDFSETDINAYVVTAVSGESATLKRVDSVPANTGVLLYGNGTYTLPEAPEAVAPEANLLVSTAKASYTVTAEDEGKAYTFDNNYFTKAAIGDAVAKKHAYLYAEGGNNEVYLVLPQVTFSGTVTDGTKAIAGATVTITDKSGEVLTLTTDAEGKFSQAIDQTNLKYVITATAQGYDSYESDSIVALSDTVLAIALDRQPIVASISSLGWTSFSSIFPIDLTESGLKAYIVTDYADGKATIVAAGTAIPAYTGVLLQGEAGDYTLAVADEAAALEGNLLGNTAAAPLEITADNYGTVYGFAEVDNAPGFFKDEAGYTIPQGEAYLPVSGSAADEFYALYDPTTGITFVIGDSLLDESQPMYNLSGQRVAKSYRGVVVQNGKKFIRK